MYQLYLKYHHKYASIAVYLLKFISLPSTSPTCSNMNCVCHILFIRLNLFQIHNNAFVISVYSLFLNAFFINTHTAHRHLCVHYIHLIWVSVNLFSLIIHRIQIYIDNIEKKKKTCELNRTRKKKRNKLFQVVKPFWNARQAQFVGKNGSRIRHIL